MSKSSTRMFTCPKCGKDYEIEIWESINVELDPDLREKLFHNEIFKVECPHCHDVYQVVHPCLYHDPENKIMVYLIDDKIEKELEANPKIPFDVIPGYTYRYCKKIMEFVEKVRILEEGLDDRIVEMAKMFCEKQIIDSKKATLEEIEFTVYNTRRENMVEIISVLKEEPVRMQLNYEQFEEIFLREEDGYEIEPNRFVRVNRNWMLDRATREYVKNIS
ncbi:CpXC domain-containing protein [Anaerorhabdus sp.]|uniref:CpXC domain-containing protein n=1 Tax=Anaerorhabdus sp. TaxID=1872524 RepID=UPI002FC99C90